MKRAAFILSGTLLIAAFMSVRTYAALTYPTTLKVTVQPIPCDLLTLDSGVAESNILQPDTCKPILNPPTDENGQPVIVPTPLAPKEVVTVIQRDKNLVGIERNYLQNAAFPASDLASTQQGIGAQAASVSKQAAYATSSALAAGSLLLIDWAFFEFAIVKAPISVLSKLLFFLR